MFLVSAVKKVEVSKISEVRKVCGSAYHCHTVVN